MIRFLGFFSKNFHRPFWLALLAVFLLIGLALTALATANHGRTIFGLSLGGVKISGLPQDGLDAFLTERIVKFEQQKISFVHENNRWELSPAELGLTINVAQNTTGALAAGHGAALSALAKQIKSAVAGEDLPLIFSIDSSRLKKSLALMSGVETPARNAMIKYDASTNDFAVTPAQNGLLINRAQLLADLLKAFGEPPGSIQLSLSEEKAAITEDELSQVIESAKKLLANAPYWLQGPAATWRLDKTELAGWISAAPAENNSPIPALALDAARINEFLLPLAVSINREPVDATLISENGQLKFLTLAQPGAKLNLAASAQEITGQLLAGAPDFDAAGKKNIELIVDAVAPRVSNQNTKELGLLTLLGKGESNFSGSSANRRVNVKVGATKLNGFLVRPGEEFSFSQNIGEIDAQNGWVPELVIKNKQTIPEFGGGLCQVSTTLFRAAVNTGLKITERHPHAYPVHYYDPPGFDATVYPPSPDFRFVNDTPGHLLLQSRIEGNRLIFEIYGTNDGRQVKVIGPITTQKNANGSLKTILTQEIWRDGKIAQSNVFRSSYNSPSLYPTLSAAPSPSPSIAPTPSPTPTPSVSP